jgi:hypothetical protein
MSLGWEAHRSFGRCCADEMAIGRAARTGTGMITPLGERSDAFPHRHESTDHD